MAEPIVRQDGQDGPDSYTWIRGRNWRHCVICWTFIYECMGKCWSNDLLAVIEGRGDWIREFCSKCPIGHWDSGIRVTVSGDGRG